MAFVLGLSMLVEGLLLGEATYDELLCIFVEENVHLKGLLHID